MRKRSWVPPEKNVFMTTWHWTCSRYLPTDTRRTLLKLLAAGRPQPDYRLLLQPHLLRLDCHKKAENWKHRPSASKQLRSNLPPNADRALACHPITEAICSSIPASNWHGNWLPPRTKSTWTVEHKFVQFEVCLGYRNHIAFNPWFLFIVITENDKNLVEHTQIRRNWGLVWRNYESMNRFTMHFTAKLRRQGMYVSSSQLNITNYFGCRAVWLMQQKVHFTSNCDL